MLAAILLATAILLTPVKQEQKAEVTKTPTYNLTHDQYVIKSNHSTNRIILGNSRDTIIRNEETNRQIRDTQAREKARSSGVPNENREKGLQLCRLQWPESECQALNFIIDHESSWNQTIKNGRCCGLFQRYDRCSDEILSDFNGQMLEGMAYIIQRYGSAKEAKEFWERNKELTGSGWY